jgi:uncharacterized ion transporter superfamily protein YfcC
VLDSGTFQRVDGRVVPGTYMVVEKSRDWLHLLGLGGVNELARPAGVVTVLQSIPLGLVRNAPLIFMVMFVGGMFGVFKQTGALDAGLDQLVHRSRGNIYLLAPVLMCALAAGSSFLGLISEYLVVLPVLLSMAERLRLNGLYAVAMLLIAAKIGYIASCRCRSSAASACAWRCWGSSCRSALPTCCTAFAAAASSRRISRPMHGPCPGATWACCCCWAWRSC